LQNCRVGDDHKRSGTTLLLKLTLKRRILTAKLACAMQNSEGLEHENEPDTASHEVPEGYLAIRLRQGEDIRPAWFKATQQVDDFVSQVRTFLGYVVLPGPKLTSLLVATVLRGRAGPWKEDSVNLHGHAADPHSFHGRVRH
jgi:hypothetical protein